MRRGNSPDQLETWLRDVRKGLSGLPRPEIEETLQELRSHVLDRLGSGDAGLDDVLASLGNPREVARLNLQARAAAPDNDRNTVVSRLQAMARLGWGGARVFLASAVGYGLALYCLVLATAKIVAPARYGLWRLADPRGDLSVSLGRYAPHAGAHDMLGFWLVPIGVAVGALSAWLTYRFDRRALNRFAPGAFRQSSFS